MKLWAGWGCGVALYAVLGAAGAATYYASPAGSDAAAGTRDAPFRTVSRAAAVMEAGDTCYLRAGIYRETVRPARSGTAAAPIVFAAYPGEAPEVTGLDLLPTAGWTVHAGAVYRLSRPAPVTDLFVDGREVARARYPAETASPYDTAAWMPMAMGALSGGACAATFSDPGRPADAWAGATVVFLPDDPAWVAYCGRVASSGAAGFAADTLSNEWRYGRAAGPGRGYFTDSLAALRTAGQWYDDAASGTLYLWTPTGVSPATRTVEGRVRDDAFDLHGRGDIQVKGIAVRAATLDLRDARHCLVQDCSVRFVAPFRRFRQGFNRDNQLAPDAWEYTGVPVSGSDNTVERCYIAESFGDGFSVWGADNTVRDCLVEGVDRSLTDAACVNVTGTGHRIVHNTLRTAGRSVLVHRRLSGGEIAYNDMGEGGCATNDLGITYTFHTDGGGTRIHHNWIHDNLASVAFAFGPGIYFDDGTANVAADHNVVWNCGVGVFVNGGCSGLQARHNTMWNVPAAVSAHVPESIAAADNLAPFAPFDGAVGDTNRTYDRVRPPFADPAWGDFRLLPWAAADSAAGACEAGDAWTAGSALASPPFADLRPANPDRLAAVPAEWGRAVRLAWRSRSRNETGFRVYRQDGTAGPSFLIASLPQGTEQYRDAAVAPGKAYRYRVAAVNAAGESAGSNRAGAKTAPADGTLRLGAAEFDNMRGVTVPGDFLGGCNAGNYVEFDNVDLRPGYTRLRTLAAAPQARPGLGFEVRLDALDGPRLCALDPGVTASWTRFQEQSVALERPAGGIHNLYVVFVGGFGAGNFKWFQLEGGKPQAGGLAYLTLPAGADGDGNLEAFPGIDLGRGAKAVSLGLAAGSAGGRVEVRLDDPAGPLLGTLDPAAAGEEAAFRTETAALSGGGGVHTLYLVFRGDGLASRVRWLRLAVDAPR